VINKKALLSQAGPHDAAVNFGIIQHGKITVKYVKCLQIMCAKYYELRYMFLKIAPRQSGTFA